MKTLIYKMYKNAVPSPSYVLEEALLIKNLELIQSVARQADVKIILALKGFSMWSVFPLVGQYLNGATASSLHEARLIVEEMGAKAHTYCVAYRADELEELLQYSSHMVFNSLTQWARYKDQVAAHNARAHHVSCGIRINPEYSEVETDLYNPAAIGSRLGEPAEKFAAYQQHLPEGIEGLHFHTLCESSSYDLEKTLEVIEDKFGDLLPQLKWINMGGGHLMTRKDYDTKHLIQLLQAFQAKYSLEIILEPGSAIAWETGTLIATVLDIHESKGIKTVLLDVSFTAHMPDTLEMPYRPRISESHPEGKYAYRMGGVSCLAGDYISEYRFEAPLQVGDRLTLEDMMHYTMVKTTTFNGVKHPSICIWNTDNELEVVRSFGYEDYKARLG